MMISLGWYTNREPFAKNSKNVVTQHWENCGSTLYLMILQIMIIYLSFLEVYEWQSYVF